MGVTQDMTQGNRLERCRSVQGSIGPGNTVRDVMIRSYAGMQADRFARKTRFSAGQGSREGGLAHALL